METREKLEYAAQKGRN